MIDKDLKKQSVSRVPKTDLIRSVVASPEWNAAIGRRLLDPHPARFLESAVSIDSLHELFTSSLNTAQQNRRQLIIVQIDSKRLTAACRLAVENLKRSTPALLLVIGSDLRALQRHGLRYSGVAAIFESFIELGAMERLVARYFASLPEPDWTLEQRIAKSL